jgi:multiple sugar transport system permease protein
MAARARTKPIRPTSPILQKWIRPFLGYATVNLFALIVLCAFLSPFAYMAVTALKDTEMITKPNAPLWPADEATFTYEEKEYALYRVPTEDGRVHNWALFKKGREESSFIDPANPAAGPIQWTGRWRTLERVWRFSPKWENFAQAWDELRMPLLLRNTGAIAIIGGIGTMFSCVAVAYGFSRFRIPGKGALFLLLISTIILPGFITIVPTYALFYRIGWVGKWWPLIVPHFFANAYNVFLLRQFFMTIPREMDEAAMIDGASPLRTLISIILPQSLPALISVGLLHFVWAWNDYFMPLLYLAGERDLQPIAIGIQEYNALYSFKPHMIQASALLGLIVPVVLFFLAQRYFVRGIVFTGVEK